MTDIKIIDIDENSKIFLFNVEKNIAFLNQSIIPNEQLEKIRRYKEDKDRTKRVLARSFLFNYCKEKYNLEDFSFEYTNNKKPKFKNSELSFSISYSMSVIFWVVTTIKGKKAFAFNTVNIFSFSIRFVFP